MTTVRTPTPRSTQTLQLPHELRVHTSRPRVLVVGSNEVLNTHVARCLAELRAEIERREWEELSSSVDGGQVRAIVLVEPVADDLSSFAAVKFCRDLPRYYSPVFIVVPEPCPPNKARRLYQAGAEAVLDWPHEEAILSLVLAESLGMAAVRGPARKPDVALARTVRSHLRIRQDFPSLKLSCRRGVISVSGELTSLSQRDDIAETIVSVPGVVALDTRALRVSPTGITDREVKRRIQSLLAAMLDDVTGISLTVESGHVVLALPEEHWLATHDLERLVSRLRGVRDLRVESVSGSDQPASDSGFARKLRRDLQLLYPEEKDVDLSFFGGAAVISGRVSTLARKREIETTLMRNRAVERVVNKLRVKS